MNDDLKFIPERVTIPCENCEGQGELLKNSSGYFDTAYGNYLPDDRTVRCEDCDGDGTVEVDRDDERAGKYIQTLLERAWDHLDLDGGDTTEDTDRAQDAAEKHVVRILASYDGNLSDALEWYDAVKNSAVTYRVARATAADGLPF